MSREAIEETVQKVGTWGKFHMMYYSCLGFVVIFSVFTMNYIFVARDIKYRCFIPECDFTPPPKAEYNPQFLKSFVPYKDEFPERCLQFNFTQNISKELCELNRTEDFNGTRNCNEFVFERPEVTIVRDFNIFCEENLWKLTIVGTVNVVGELVSLSYSGFLSDWYGRKRIMALNLLLSSICGIAKSFSLNYYMFLVFEFLDTALGGAMYGGAFVLAMELVNAKDRNLGNTVISCIYAIGQIILGIVAWLTPNWRVMVRILYFPGLLSVFIWIFLPESIRWLLSKNKFQEATSILNKIAKVNGNELISHNEMEDLTKALRDHNLKESEKDRKIPAVQANESFISVLKNPILLLRTIHCSMTWVCCTFVFYGLTIHSVEISENMYLSFIFGAIAETPGYVIYSYANEKLGRRKLMSSTLVLGGVFCLAVGFLPEGWLKLSSFFCGKCCLTIAYTVLYVFTTELFPTSSRHAMFSICSMFGRFGSMIAPQIPLLAIISKRLPLILFSAVSVLFGFLAMLFPETSHVPLPHTIEDALKSRRCRHEDDFK